MLDEFPSFLTKYGRVVIEAHNTSVEGFGAHEASCREVAALALVWAIGVLQRELQATLEKPGGGNVGVD